jgi:hypothetical protein
MEKQRTDQDRAGAPREAGKCQELGSLLQTGAFMTACMAKAAKVDFHCRSSPVTMALFRINFQFPEWHSREEALMEF